MTHAGVRTSRSRLSHVLAALMLQMLLQTAYLIIMLAVDVRLVKEQAIHSLAFAR